MRTKSGLQLGVIELYVYRYDIEIEKILFSGGTPPSMGQGTISQNYNTWIAVNNSTCYMVCLQ